MFTGIIETVGIIRSVQSSGKDLSLEIDAAGMDLSDTRLGDSIAVNGVCLTVVRLSGTRFAADVSVESLVNTRIGDWRVGTNVNLEKALTLATRLGGHLVSGHVDSVARIQRVYRQGRSTGYELECPQDLRRFVARKGSVAIDGVSLTVTDLTDTGFVLNIVPHTQQSTIIPSYGPGHQVHLEVDMMARYAERLMQADVSSSDRDSASPISLNFLRENGYPG